ncbi:hypothetical protein J5N97_025322 [Dioscorea zingiberensis]|uniref:PORR domain-containing protein n=1 Tax=Dioscorea zingiberensis TaxID=325984 RepID=A0A9D5C8P5_9LILI|nr:hypothetical protein J5N97_025322 [Dioscorea zingiberensis]
MPSPAILRRLTSAMNGGRSFSQSTSIPKKLQRVRDHAFDDYMEIQKKVRRALKLQELILSHPSQTLPVSRLDSLARRYAGLAPHESGSFPPPPPPCLPRLRAPRPASSLGLSHPRALNRSSAPSPRPSFPALPSTVLRLRKLLLLLLPCRRLRLEHVRLARRDLALPDDFSSLRRPSQPSQFFRLVSP